MTRAFHLNNTEAKCELTIHSNNNLLPFCTVPTYLRLKLDRSFAFRHHTEALREKLKSHVALLRRLAGSGLGTDAKTLRISALSLVYSTAECCALAWCHSTHNRFIDNVLNDAMRIVTGYLRPTSTDLCQS